MIRELGRYRYPAQAAKALQELAKPLDKTAPNVHMGGQQWFYRILPEGERWVLRAFSEDELRGPQA